MKFLNLKCNFILIFITSFLFIACKDKPVVKKKTVSPYYTLSDVNLNKYKALKFGQAIWMVENLKTTYYSYRTTYGKYDSIHGLYPANRSIVNLEKPPKDTLNYQVTYNGADSNLTSYGRLYTWHTTVDQRNLCPTGWHLPSEKEWDTIISFLGGAEIAGGKMKDITKEFWKLPNVGATNSSLFSARGGGYRTEFGSFINQGLYGYYWSSTADPSDETSAIAYCFYAGTSKIYKSAKPKRYAMSVRCVKN